MAIPNQNGHFDVAVVGGGIVGLSAALYLARSGQSVILCERGKFGAEQSSRAWGFVRKQGRHPEEIPLAELAIGLWDEITKTYGADATAHVKSGVIMPAETDVDEELIHNNYSCARDHGLASELLKPKQLANKCPELRTGWRCALFTPGDGHADPATATRTIELAAREAGATLAENVTVTGFETGASRVKALVTSAGTI